METIKTAVREKITVKLPSQLLERARNIVFWTPGLTLSALAKMGFQHAINSVERKHGQPLPQRTQNLRVGRPITRATHMQRARG